MYEILFLRSTWARAKNGDGPLFNENLGRPLAEITRAPVRVWRIGDKLLPTIDVRFQASAMAAPTAEMRALYRLAVSDPIKAILDSSAPSQELTCCCTLASANSGPGAGRGLITLMAIAGVEVFAMESA